MKPIILTPSSTPDTLVPEVVASPTKIPTPLAFPTPTTDETLNRIKQMQETNGSCKLPCWWGITPGITTRDAAKRIFAPVRRYGTNHGVVGFSFPDYYGIDASIEIENGIVREIWILGSTVGVPEGNVAYTPFDESWSPYFIWSMCDQLGVPSKVQLGLGYTVDEDGQAHFIQYEIHVFYKGSGVVVRYMGFPDETETGNVSACLARSRVTDIRIFIREPVTSPDGFQVPPWDYQLAPRSVEEAANLSLVEFYENFQGGQNCLESAPGLWLDSQ